MTRRITLIRHGRSAHREGGWHDAASVRRWLDAYDVAGLVPAEAPPPGLVALAGEAGVLVSSDLRRAKESAALLGHRGGVVDSPLLREAAMPIPTLGGARLPVAAWGIAVGLRWLHGTRRGELPDPETACRAGDAAAWLETLADAHGTVFAVTHATMRQLISVALIRRGWAGTGPRRSIAHWSAWTHERSPTTSGPRTRHAKAGGGT